MLFQRKEKTFRVGVGEGEGKMIKHYITEIRVREKLYHGYPIKVTEFVGDGVSDFTLYDRDASIEALEDYIKYLDEQRRIALNELSKR
jgi:hypothetical protein